LFFLLICLSFFSCHALAGIPSLYSEEREIESFSSNCANVSSSFSNSVLSLDFSNINRKKIASEIVYSKDNENIIPITLRASLSDSSDQPCQLISKSGTKISSPILFSPYYQVDYVETNKYKDGWNNLYYMFPKPSLIVSDSEISGTISESTAKTIMNEEGFSTFSQLIGFSLSLQANRLGQSGVFVFKIINVYYENKTEGDYSFLSSLYGNFIVSNFLFTDKGDQINSLSIDFNLNHSLYANKRVIDTLYADLPSAVTAVRLMTSSSGGAWVTDEPLSLQGLKAFSTPKNTTCIPATWGVISGLSVLSVCLYFFQDHFSKFKSFAKREKAYLGLSALGVLVSIAFVISMCNITFFSMSVLYAGVSFIICQSLIILSAILSHIIRRQREKK